jgi:hypothetical protein
VLALEWYPWTYAGVHGNIGVAGPGQRELHEKFDMRGRNGVEQMRVLRATETGIHYRTTVLNYYEMVR